LHLARRYRDAESGGHPLTVAEVKKDEVLCLWMGAEGDPFRETLPLAVLVPTAGLQLGQAKCTG
jgi:hypothetical protein